MAAGQGKPGFCSLCASPYVRELNKLARAGAKSTEVQALLAKHGETTDRRTWYKHKPHALTPEDKVVQLAEQGKKALTIRRSSNTAFLESLRDIGFTKAIDDPDAVSLEHALKAVSILEARKDKGGDVNILVAISTGHRPTMEIIEGEVREVSTA